MHRCTGNPRDGAGHQNRQLLRHLLRSGAAAGILQNNQFIFTGHPIFFLLFFSGKQNNFFVILSNNFRINNKYESGFLYYLLVLGTYYTRVTPFIIIIQNYNCFCTLGHEARVVGR